MDKLLEKLMKAFGVSSREEEMKSIIRQSLEEIKNSNNIDIDIKEDNIGNIIVKLGRGSERIMVCTHMDNSGVMVTLVENNGFVRVSPIGNLKPEKLIRNLMKFENGALGRVDASKANPSKDDLFIDLGVSSKELANEKIKEGDIAEVIGQGFTKDDKIVAPNLHSKLGCYALLEVIKRIKDVKSLNKELYFVFTSQMEVGFRGARAAAEEIKPSVAIVLDSIEAEDYIGGNAALKLEGGPILSIYDKSLVIHHEVKRGIENTAQGLNMNLQYNIGSERNEGGLIHKEVGGIKTGMIGIPCRYMYTSAEMMSFKDINDTISLIGAIVTSDIV